MNETKPITLDTDKALWCDVCDQPIPPAEPKIIFGLDSRTCDQKYPRDFLTLHLACFKP